MASHENSDYSTSFDPQTQLETARTGGGSGGPPSKTAVGTGGPGDRDDFPGEYTPGQQLKCKIVGERQGGYDVLICELGFEVRAFLRTKEKHEIGEVLTVKFHSYQDR